MAVNTTTSSTVSQLLFDYLAEVGVEYIFGVSGHSAFDLTDALYQQPKIRFVPSQIEHSAGYMASAYARGTRRLGVCLVSEGPGATNLVSGVAHAYKESYPVLAISADTSTRVSGKGASAWHEVPQEAIFRPITKMSATITKPEETLAIIRRAVWEATTGKKGPVYVGIPTDIQAVEIEVPPPPWAEEHAETAAIDPTLVARAAEVLAQAEAPTIIVGGGAYWAQCTDEVVELAELLRSPFATTPSHKGLISEQHPLSLGILGQGAFPFANKVCQASDVILALGTTFSEPLTAGFGNQVIPSKAKIIHVDIDPTEIGKSYPTDIGVVGDAGDFIRQTIQQLKNSGRTGHGSASRIREMQRQKKEWKEELETRGAAINGAVIKPSHIYHALQQALSEETLIVVEGVTLGLLQSVVVTSELYSGGEFRAIGHGVATSIGAKFAFPDRPVVCVSGDGSFMMELQELATAAREGLAIVFIVFRNDAYGGMKRDQVRHYHGRVIGTDLFIPDLCVLGSSFGAHVERVEKPVALVPAITSALSARRPALLEVICPVEGL